MSQRWPQINYSPTMTRRDRTNGVQIAGTGLTSFGDHPDRPAWNLFAEAGINALDEASVTPTDVDEVYYGNFVGGLVEEQGHQTPLVAESLGIDAPATRFESACASSGVALRHAIKDVRRGNIDVAVVGGAEQMTSVDTAETTRMLATASDSLYEIRPGMTFPRGLHDHRRRLVRVIRRVKARPRPHRSQESRQRGGQRIRPIPVGDIRRRCARRTDCRLTSRDLRCVPNH